MTKEGSYQTPGSADPAGRHDDFEPQNPFSKLEQMLGPAFVGAKHDAESPTPGDDVGRKEQETAFLATIGDAMKAAEEKAKKGDRGDSNQTGGSKPKITPKTALSAREQKRINRANARKEAEEAADALKASSKPAQEEPKQTEPAVEAPEAASVPPVSTEKSAVVPEERPDPTKNPEQVKAIPLAEARKILDAPENQSREGMQKLLEELKTMKVIMGNVKTGKGRVEDAPKNWSDVLKQRLKELPEEPASADAPGPKEKPEQQVEQQPEPVATEPEVESGKPEDRPKEGPALGTAPENPAETKAEEVSGKKENKDNLSSRNLVTPKELRNLISLHKKNAAIKFGDAVKSLDALKTNLETMGMAKSRGGERIDAEPYIGEIDEAKKEILLQRSENKPEKPSQKKDMPKSYEAIVDRLKEINTEEALHKVKSHLLRVGILTETGEVKKFEPGSKEEATFLSSIDTLYDDMHSKKRKHSNKQIAEEAERDTASRYAQHKRKDFEDSSRDTNGMKEKPVDVEKAEDAPMKAQKTPKAQAIPAKTKAVSDIENLFNYPRPSSYKFQSIEQALNEPGFAEFIDQHDKHNKIESDTSNEAVVENLYYTYMNARSMSEHVQTIFNQELLKDLGDEITLPDDAIKAIEKHFSHLCVENPHEIEDLTEKVQEFLDLPGKIQAEEAKINAELVALGGSYQGGIDAFNRRFHANEAKKQRLSELIEFKKLMDAPKGVGYFDTAEEASKLIKEGVLTGRFGYDKNYPFAHLFKPAEKIQMAIDKLMDETKLERAKLGDTRSKIEDWRTIKKGLEADYLEIKRLILSGLAPSEIVKKAVTRTIKEKIKSQIEDPNLRFNKSGKAQSLLEKARNAQDLSSGYGIDYFTEEQAEETQKEIADAIKAEVGGQIDKIIQEAPMGVAAYTKLEQKLLRWLDSVKASDRKFGSKQGVAAQRFIIEVIEEKMTEIKQDKVLSPKRHLLKLFLDKVKNNEIPGLSRQSK